MDYYAIYGKEYLAHHGILGQKWGQRNGPPYPLNPEDHSKAEKQAAKKFQLSEKQKKYLKIGVAVVGAALITYGAYKLHKSGILDKYISIGKEKAKLMSPLRGIIEDSNIKTLNSLDEDGAKLLSTINTDRLSGNCTNCTSAVVGRLFGLDVSASKNLENINYRDFMQKVFKKTDDDIKSIYNPDFGKMERSILRRAVEGDTGSIGLEWNEKYAALYKARTGKDIDSLAHIFNYRVDKDKSGNLVLTLLDGQIAKDRSYIENFMNVYLNSNKELSYSKIGNINDGLEKFLESIDINEYKKFVR